MYKTAHTFLEMMIYVQLCTTLCTNIYIHMYNFAHRKQKCVGLCTKVYKIGENKGDNVQKCT